MNLYWYVAIWIDLVVFARVQSTEVKISNGQMT